MAADPAGPARPVGPGRPVGLLVIGIGSELHGDDAVGRVVADRLEDLRLAGVRVRSVCQLVPELVEELAACARVVFVDADPGRTEVTVREVAAADVGTAVTHHATPAGLLRLAGIVGVVPPAAVLVGVPARHLELGAGLSPQARAGVETAVETIRRLASASASAPAAGQARA